MPMHSLTCVQKDYMVKYQLDMNFISPHVGYTYIYHLKLWISLTVIIDRRIKVPEEKGMQNIMAY